MKLEEGFLIGPELCLWTSLEALMKHFLENNPAENAKLLLNDFLEAYKKLSYRMSINSQFLMTNCT